MFKKIKQELKEGKTFLQFGIIKSLGQGLGMIAPLVIAEFFEPDIFGKYSLARMIVFFFITLLIQPSQLAFIVIANQEKAINDKINRTFTAQGILFLFSCFFFVMVLALFNQEAMVFTKLNRGDLLFVLLAFIGLAIKNFLSNLFMATDEKIKNSLAELVYGFLSILVIFFFHFTWGINLRTVLSIYPISSVFLLIFFVPTLKLKILLPLKVDTKYFWAVLNFTKWQFLGMAAVYFINWGDNLVLRYYNFSMSDIGVYNLAYQIFKSMIILASTICSYFLPYISQNINNSEKIHNYLVRKRPKILVIGIAGSVAVTLLGWLFLSKVHSGLYKDAGLILFILMPGAICHLYTFLYRNLYNAAKLNRCVQIFDIIQVTLNVSLSFVLIKYFGLIGAAIATVTAYVLKTVIMTVHFKKSIETRLYSSDKGLLDICDMKPKEE